uniref:SH3_10 domain-containing protein n=1 Tax=Macrostomum lignano TaxID=282301 RepID=A0A1I8FUM7_9PLAT
TVLEPGEQVTVIDNSQSYSWTVRRSGGSEVEVPSTCIWLPPADPEAVQLAIGLRRKLLNTWSQILNSLRQWIAEFFDSYLTQMLKSPVGVARKTKDVAAEFLHSLRQSSQTFLGVDDQLTDRLVKSVEKVLEKMTICEGPKASLAERELVILQACLAKLQEHLSEWRHCSNEATEAETELQGRFTDRFIEGVFRSSGAHRTAFLQEESQSKFEELQRSMQNWRLQDVKSNFKANQKAPQLLFYDKYSLSIMHSVTGGPAVSTRTQYVPETTQTEEQYSINTHGRQFHTSVSDSKTTVRYSFTSSSQMATEKQQIDDTFSPEFQAAVLKYSEAHKLEFSALVSSW